MINEVQEFYLDFKKGNIFKIPKNLEKEYKRYFQKEFEKNGNSARSYSKRKFSRQKYAEENKERFERFKNELETKYNDGFGYKLIARDLGISYTTTRNLFSYLEIETRKGYNVVTERVKQFRKEKANLEYKNRTGIFKTFERKTNKTSRGVQGYYFNESKQKYVWLRSTYEYIYAKWLDKNNIDWDVEVKTYQLENTTYRPDFFIYEDKNLSKIVEIKGYWDNRKYKTLELSKQLSQDIILITDIKPYTPIGYRKELKEWKLIKLNEQELNELQ